MPFSCGCGREFHQEESLLQHKRDAHGDDTSARLKEITESKKASKHSDSEGYKIPRYYIYGLGVLVLIIAGFFFLQPTATGAIVSENSKANSAGFLELGDPNAPNVIEEFGDYECPFCMRFHTTTFGQIKKDYIDTGKARYIFKDFPLTHSHINAQKAAEAAHCADDQGKYEEYHDKLYQNSYSGDNWGNKPSVPIFKRYAADLGLDTNRFNRCLDNSEKTSIVKANLEEGQRRGVSGTPSFFVNGRFISGAQPYNVFSQLMR